MKERDNKGFWDKWARRYDRTMSADRDIYTRILNRMKRKLNRNMVVLELACGTGILSVQLAGNVKMLEATELSGFRVFHKWKPQEYLDFLKENGFTVTDSKVYGGVLALTYAEAK